MFKTKKSAINRYKWWGAKCPQSFPFSGFSGTVTLDRVQYHWNNGLIVYGTIKELWIYFSNHRHKQTSVDQTASLNYSDVNCQTIDARPEQGFLQAAISCGRLAKRDLEGLKGFLQAEIGHFQWNCKIYVARLSSRVKKIQTLMIPFDQMYEQLS